MRTTRTGTSGVGLRGGRAAPRAALAAALVLVAAGLTTLPRPSATLAPILLVVAVALASGRDTVPRTALRLVVGLVPAVVVVGALHDLAGSRLPTPLSALLLAAAWAWASRTLGASVAAAVRGPGALRDVALRMLGVLSVTTFVAGAMVRLLLPPSSAIERLSWILGEEDNAHVVGVAREVLTDGPRGASLADQFGTAFANVPLLLARMLGGLPAADQDPRLQAVAVFTVSTLVIIVLAGLAMALLASLPHHVHRRHGPDEAPSMGLTTSILGAVGSGVATAAGMSVLVVLPLRTGFLTFVWGLTLILAGAAVAAVLPSVTSRAARLTVVAHLAGLVVLLLSSWPFILPALIGPLLLPLLWLRWDAIASSIRQHAGRWALGALTSVVALAGLGFAFTEWGPAAEVLSYGVEILTANASGIGADDLLRRSAFVAIAAAAIVVVLARRRSRALPVLLPVLGPIVGAGALYLGLRLAAELLTEGELNYAGIKLLYGIVVLATILGLLTLLSQTARTGPVVGVAVTTAVTILLWVSPTAALITDWWTRTDLGAPPHARATVEAIERTSPDLPIRCLPAPGTVVTGTSRLAAYMCVRWMEDAFNEGRFQGHRDELLTAEGETFEATVRSIEERSMSEYLFAHRFTMGPGWFGWNGADR